VLAVISLADRREWSRYQYRHSGISLVGSIACGLALAIRANLGRRPPMASGDEASHGRLEPGPYKSDVKTRVRSSLTGILGSVEMIKSHPESTPEILDRYLSIIDQSARRINECLVDRAVAE